MQNVNSKIKFWFKYIFFVSIFILIVLEILIRALKLAPSLDKQYSVYVADNKIGYRHQPLSHLHGFAANNEFEFDYQHNSIGFRDIERTIEKPKNIFRILMLGDSYTYGAGAKYDETYPSQLEKLLNSRSGNHMKVEVIRAGISRSFPEMERKVLETYGLQYKPDLVFLGFLPNDLIDTFMAKYAVQVTDSGYLMMGDKDLLGFKLWLYSNSHLWRQFRFMLYQLSSRVLWKQKYSDSGMIHLAWEKVFDEFEKINQLSKVNNFKFFTIYIPQNGPWDEEARIPEKLISKNAAEKNYGFISTLDSFINEAKRIQCYTILKMVIAHLQDTL